MTVKDKNGLSASETAMVVVYDPSADFVSGGGWFYSPKGSYIPYKSLTGRANFSFISGYKKGAKVSRFDDRYMFFLLLFVDSHLIYCFLILSGPDRQD